jgi:hypothetical protein
VVQLGSLEGVPINFSTSNHVMPAQAGTSFRTYSGFPPCRLYISLMFLSAQRASSMTAQHIALGIRSCRNIKAPIGNGFSPFGIVSC